MLRTYMMFYMSVPPSFCFCSPKGTIMKIRSILTYYPCHCILIVKLLDAYIAFCKVVFYTPLLYPFFVVANKYFLTKGLFTWSRGNSLPRGNSLTPGSTLPRCMVWRLQLFTWVFSCPGATSRGGLSVIEHRVTRLAEVTFLYVNRTQKLPRGKNSLAHAH